MKTLAIVGGGAGGLACAVAAGERARWMLAHAGENVEAGAALGANAPLPEIVVYEADDRVGRSILATGNGRCNFTNEHLCVDGYTNARFAEDVERAAIWSYCEVATKAEERQLKDNGTVDAAFLYQHGLLWTADEQGRCYPRTNKASTVLDVLRASAAAVGARETCGCAVRAVEPPSGKGGRFTLRLDDGRLVRADAVVVACGGRAVDALDVAGLPKMPTQPVLGPLACRETAFTRELDNIRVACTVRLLRPCADGQDPEGCEGGLREVARETGELLFRKYGVSGICVFNLSRFARPGDVLSVDLAQSYMVKGRMRPQTCEAVNEAMGFLFRRRKLLVARSAGGVVSYADMLRGWMLPRVGEAVLKRAGIGPAQAFAKKDAAELARVLTDVRLTVSGIGDEKLCQVRRGGLDVASFDPCTCQARGVPGLFAVGEALDVDGPCGGYNLHWAWTSGLLAGWSAARFLLES